MPEVCKILLVDDDEVDRLAVKRALRGAGSHFELEEACDAEQALTALRSRRFDAVLLDYRMPGRDGAFVLGEAVALGVSAPILMLTGQGDEELAVAMIRAGAADYIPKAGVQAGDLGQRIRQAIRLCEAQHQAREAQEALARRIELEEKLIGIVSHDLRNPLGTIRLAADVLEMTGLADGQKRHVDRIKRAVSRCESMIHDLLDFTQARLGGQIPLQRGPANLHHIARQVATEMTLGHPDRPLEITAAGDGHGSWDAGRLTQVVMNLVGNALQHGERGSPVRVHTATGPSEALLEVSNQGTAIPPEELATLFEPLRRGDLGAVTDRGGSIGLGLYITRQIVLAHGGDVSAGSTPEGRTTFTVRLPRHPPSG